jgi:DNA-directed RNA polymerase specialized sigma24 family protein
MARLTHLNHFQSYKDRVLEVAYYMTKSIEIAKDLMQSFFMGFWQNREKLAKGIEPGAYIHSSIYHLALRHLKAKGYEGRYQLWSSSISKVMTTKLRNKLQRGS